MTLRNTTVSTNLTTALGGTPAANSDIIISEGNLTYSAGTDISTNEVNTLKVTASFKGGLGTAGSHVTVDLSAATYTGTLDYDGENANDAYVEAKTDIQRCNIHSTGKAVFYAAGGTYTRLDQSKGTTEVGGSTVLVTGNFLGGKTTILDNATAVTTLNGRNMESMQIERSMTTGTFDNCPNLVFDSYSDAFTTLSLKNSNMSYNGGTITTLTLEGNAVLDLRNVVQDVTITNSTIDKTATILFPTAFTVTFTNPSAYPGGKPAWAA